MKRGYEIDKKRHVTRDETDKKEYKNKHKSSKKRAKDCRIQTLLHTFKVNRITSFHTQRKSFKKERYLILNSFNNRNAITKARFSSLNFAINSSK